MYVRQLYLYAATTEQACQKPGPYASVRWLEVLTFGGKQLSRHFVLRFANSVEPNTLLELGIFNVSPVITDATIGSIVRKQHHIRTVKIAYVKHISDKVIATSHPIVQS